MKGIVMIKAGDLFRRGQSGKAFSVRNITASIIMLVARDGTPSMFVNPNSIDRVLMSFM
jgi:hypothetical protein